MFKFNLKSVRDWNIIVFSFGLLLIVISIVAWQIYLSNKLGGGYINTTNQTSAANRPILSESKLSETLDVLAKRKNNSLSPKNYLIKVVDPAI